MEGYEVKTLQSVIPQMDIVVTATGNKDVVKKEDILRMKNNAVICNIGHFENEIDMHGLLTDPNIKRVNIKPQVDRFEFDPVDGTMNGVFF